jgi:CMP-N,N'-diacetyllegionaminic acid synthase
MSMRIVGIIPARGGSKGVPRKNVLPILGKPVITWTIEAALRASRLTEVVVSTDDAEIKNVAQRSGIRVIDRPPELATDTSAIDPSLRHAVRVVESDGRRVDVAVWIQANVPTVRNDIIDAVIECLIASGGTSCQTVVPYRVPPQWAWRIEGNRLIELEGVYAYTTRRQDVAQAYHPDGSVNAILRDVLMNAEGAPPPAYLGRDRRAVIQSHLDGVEIDSFEELALCEWVLSRRQENMRGPTRQQGGLAAPGQLAVQS